MEDRCEGDDDGVCVFCGRSGLSSTIVGDTYTQHGVTVHQNCLYFSSGLAQNGQSEKDGICGFLVTDILAEVRRASSRKMVCSVCRKPGKFVGCSVPSCPKGGHYPCLHDDAYLFQHFDEFLTFCPRHAPSQQGLPQPHENCCICLSPLSENGLYCPCCRAMFHRSCVQMQASTAGRYFFRCPTCNNDKEFIEEMLKMGVAIPERDAKWETDNYFGPEFEDPKFCQVHSCVCPMGREHHSRKYQMLKCQTCGRWMGHVICLQGRPKECLLCASVAEKLAEAQAPSPTSQPHTPAPGSQPHTPAPGSQPHAPTHGSQPHTPTPILPCHFSTSVSKTQSSSPPSQLHTLRLRPRPASHTWSQSCTVAKKRKGVRVKLLNPRVVVHRMTLQEISSATRVIAAEVPHSFNYTEVSSVKESFGYRDAGVNVAVETPSCSDAGVNVANGTTSCSSDVSSLTAPDLPTVVTKLSEPIVPVNSPTQSYACDDCTVTSWSGRGQERHVVEWIVHQDVDNEFKFLFSRVYS